MNILDVAGVMAYTGLARQTIHQYHSEGLMPPADGRVGRSPWWYKATIDQWVKEREEQK